MADLKTPHKEVHRAAAKKEFPKSHRMTKKHYCLLCRRFYSNNEAHEHMHSMLHHKELEEVLGKDAFHDCQACKVNSLSLDEYARHISTAQHAVKLKSLKTRNIKPVSLFKILSKEAMQKVTERNKALKKEEKKAFKKKKKKKKQQAGQRRSEMQQGAARRQTVFSKGTAQKESEAMQLSLPNPMQSHYKGGIYVVVQNKENKVSSLQRPLNYRESTLQTQSKRPSCQSEGPAGRPHHQYDCEHFTQVCQLRYDEKFSGGNLRRQVRFQSSQTDGCSQTPHKEEAVADKPSQTVPAVSQHRYYTVQYNSQPDRDFTSDNLPEKGAIVFDHNQGGNTHSSQPEGSSCSAQPPPAIKPVSAASIRDMDVTVMLKQIRRALGVREPCRADREARRQNNDAGVRAADCSPTQQTEAKQLAGTFCRNHLTSSPAVLPPQVNTPASITSAGGCPSSMISATSKKTTFKKTQEMSDSCREGSPAADQLSNSTERQSQGAFEGWTSVSRNIDQTSSEPNLGNTRKVRIAHRSRAGEKEAVQKPTLGKLLNLSGTKSKLSWRKTYGDMKKKNVRGSPRFGIKLVNHQTDHESFAWGDDPPLSEGFHWESFPGGVSGLNLTLPPPSDDSHMGTQSVSQTQDSSEQPEVAQTSRPVTEVSVKVEPNCEDARELLGDKISAGKRGHDDDGVSDKPGGKKKKKSNKGNLGRHQMDQLLSVSLREDELSHSLQDLDKSLVQARSVLQAAYADVQRLLLLRQQFTNEVNSLRTKRIEILQSMQEGYSGESNTADMATASSAGAAATAPSPSLLSSSALPATLSHQTPAAAPSSSSSSSSISQPNATPQTLSGVSLNQEVCPLAPAGQASSFSKAAPFNAETSQVPVNQPLLPSDLPPALALRPSRLAAPKGAQQPSAESSTPFPETSARQKEQKTQEGLKSSMKTKALAKEAPRPQRRVKEMSGENLGMVQVKAKEPAAEKSVSKRERKATEVDDEGNESDHSVEMVTLSNQEVIDVEESDCDQSAETIAPEQPEAPQKSVSMDSMSESSPTAQQDETESKFQPSPMPTKNASTPAESLEDVEPSLGSFSGHTGPVHGLQVHDGLLFTCSGDNTARAYNLVSRECQAVFEGHTNKVNCLLVSSPPNMPTRLYTGSSDETIRCYSVKSKKCLEQLSLPDRVLCLHIAWNILYAGLASGSVITYDLKTLKEMDAFECHGPRGVSCLGTAQEGARRLLLVGSYDSTISVRDAKSGLLLRSLQGHTKTVLCMKVVNDLVFSGSSDTSVHAHNIHTGELLRIYKGHSHAVTSIVILGKVMVTACLDKLVRVYELQSHDRLQVYGGHSDMVMCMAVHKSVIYTGCYDGSIQAVKLNLMKNHRCWWQSCSLIFGMPEHLIQHLVSDHSNPNLQTVKCRWRGCEAFFATQHSVRQDLPEHMQNHVESDSKPQS